MISLIKLNIKSILKNKSYKNYIRINTILFSVILVILTIKYYCNREIDKVINLDDYKVINVNSYDNNSWNEFLESNKDYIKNIRYEVTKYDVIVNDDSYDIRSNEDDFLSNEKAIMINSDRNIEIKELEIDEVINRDDVLEEVIYVNQELAKYMVDKDYYDELVITIIVNDYDDREMILERLGSLEIDANLNEVDMNFNVYQRLNKVLNIFLIFLMSLVGIMLVVLTMMCLFEQKKNIMIYYNLGYRKILIGWIYFGSFVYLLLVSLFISLGIEIVILGILKGLS